MFGGNRARALNQTLDRELHSARQKLEATGGKLDRVIADSPIQEMMRRALAKVEETNRNAPHPR